ncbi:hypothetical protein AURDEDRAFT_114102 [Auricularia subglabra TFB-10046 SS5]|nr:hypothetical protein AURDEDRAFT_114102 [Auricularia subglabra TFB-10046 SS5]
MQNVFASMTEAALQRIQTLIDRFRAHGLPVIFTQHGHSKAELTGPPYSNQLVRKWGPGGSIHTGSHDWELQPPVRELVGDAPVVA